MTAESAQPRTLSSVTRSFPLQRVGSGNETSCLLEWLSWIYQPYCISLCYRICKALIQTSHSYTKYMLSGGLLIRSPHAILQEFPDVALDIQEKTGLFYRVKAEMIELKFSAQPIAPSRPPPPSNPAPQSGKTRSSSSGDGRSRFPGLFHHHKNSGTSGKSGFV